VGGLGTGRHPKSGLVSVTVSLSVNQSAADADRWTQGLVIVHEETY